MIFKSEIPGKTFQSECPAGCLRGIKHNIPQNEIIPHSLKILLLWSSNNGQSNTFPTMKVDMGTYQVIWIRNLDTGLKDTGLEYNYHIHE